MSSLYESCKEKLSYLFDWYKENKGNRNEATTRLHLIDTIFFECLGWDRKADCITEERFEGKYTDYTFHAPHRLLILEAKKEGTYFDIPDDYSNGKYKIKTLKEDVPNLREAVDQVADYCQKRGVPLAAISNGHQMVAFIGSRQDGQAPDEGKAIVFESFEILVNKFRLLWDCLSKPGAQSSNLQRNLSGFDSPYIPRKLSQSISLYPGIKNRNILQTDLQILADLVFEDIISATDLEKAFLDKCYCQIGALSQYALISKSLLENRYEALFKNIKKQPKLIPATNKKGLSKDLIAEGFSRRPVLILGDVGVGKTIFFKHFIKVEAKEIFENAILIYIDFGSKAAFAKDIRDFVLEEIERQLRKFQGIDIMEDSFVRGIYHGEIKRFGTGIYGELRESSPDEYRAKEIKFLEEKINDKEQHLISSLDHISKGRKQQVVIFLDNSDQRSDKVQQHVFIISESIAETWPATIFLALRPETFHRSKKLGSMSAYHLKAFTISPPRIDKVLEKRLLFAEEITSGKIPISSLPSEISINFEKVGAFLKIIQQSLDRSDEIVECIDNLAGGNVRMALEFIKKLIGSGHIDTKKILDIYSKSGSYYIRLHEFLRTIIFGDNIYFDPYSSPVINLFDVITDDAKEHFLSCAVLQLIESEGVKGKKHGFVREKLIYDFFQSAGFSIPQLSNSLSYLCEAKLLETAGRIKPLEEDISSNAVRLTTIGAYHLQRLPYMFLYYDAIVTDVPILDREYREQITDVHDIFDRLERGNSFLSYLNMCAQQYLPKKLNVSWNEMHKSAVNNIRNISEVLDKAQYGKVKH